jgi:hypothetical protein
MRAGSAGDKTFFTALLHTISCVRCNSLFWTRKVYPARQFFPRGHEQLTLDGLKHAVKD